MYRMIQRARERKRERDARDESRYADSLFRPERREGGRSLRTRGGYAPRKTSAYPRDNAAQKKSRSSECCRDLLLLSFLFNATFFFASLFSSAGNRFAFRE